MLAIDHRFRRLPALFLLVLAGAFLAAAPVRSQLPVPEENAAASAEEVPTDPFGRTTPAGSVTGYVEAIAAGDYELATRFLDLDHLRAARREAVGPGLARQFQAALDREGVFQPRTQLSRDPTGNLSDSLEPDLEKVGTLGDGEDPEDLLLRRIEQPDGRHVWLFAADTLQAALDHGVSDRSTLAERWLPAQLSRWQAWGAPVSHWVTLAAISLAGFLVGWLLFRLLLLAYRKSGERLRGSLRFVCAVAVPLILFAAVGFAGWIAPLLEISIVAREAFAWLTFLVGWVAFAWLLWRLIDLLAERALAGFARRGRASATAIIRMASRAAKLMIIAAAVIAIFDIFGFQVTTAIAALGIGGLALALGAQKTLENLFASVSIISDRPFKVGDVCRIGTQLGTVEDIGLRSTRMRTLARTILVIPNASLVNAEVENYSARDQFWFNPIFHIEGAAAPDRLRALLDALRATLVGDERLFEGQARIRLLPPVDARLPIEVFAYILAEDFEDYLAIQEDLLLKSLETIAGQNFDLAPPGVDLGGTRSA